MGEPIFHDHFPEIAPFSPKLKAFIFTVKGFLSENPHLQECFMLWKQVSQRLSDADYTSSKQQVKSKNPTEEDLHYIYAAECTITLLLQCLAVKKMEAFEDIPYDRIREVMEEPEKYHRSSIHFFFTVDIFNIWKYLFNKDNSNSSRFPPSIEIPLREDFPVLLSILNKIPPDRIFFSLHQEILPPDLRKRFGEFYTPPKMAEIIIRNAILCNPSPSSIIDFSCGSGILLTETFRLTLSHRPESTVDHMIGIDINPISVLIAKFSLFFCYYLNFYKPTMDPRISYYKSPFEPLIFCADSLLSFTTSPYNVIQIKRMGQPQRDSSDNGTVQLEFLGQIYPIGFHSQKSVSGKIFRRLCREQLQLLFTPPQPHSHFSVDGIRISIPDELLGLITNSSFRDYLIHLLCDRLCAIHLLRVQHDLILGNPPYMRVQSIHPLWKRELYTRHFISAIGHFDIYYLFIEIGCKLLAENGCMGFVTSGKFTKTRSGGVLRRMLAHHLQIRRIIDFGDSHVFDATVLPWICIFSRPRSENPLRYIGFSKYFPKETEKDGTALATAFLAISLDHLVDSLCTPDENFPFTDENTLLTLTPSKKVEMIRYDSPQPSQDAHPWRLISPTVRATIKKIDSETRHRLGDLAEKISVGIKTTANYAFIDPYGEEFLNREEIKREREQICKKYGQDLFHPLIRGQDIREGRLDVKDPHGRHKSFIFYPHFKDPVSGKVHVIPEQDIPVMIGYLRTMGFEAKLSQREYITAADRRWYEIWNPKDPADMRRPKLVVPDISPCNNFAVDTEGSFVEGTAYFILLKNEAPDFLLSVRDALNSEACDFYHKNTATNVLYGNRYRYWSSDIANLPLSMNKKWKNIKKIERKNEKTNCV